MDRSRIFRRLAGAGTLLALCVEVVLSTRKTSITDPSSASGPQSTAFPWVLRALGVLPLGFWNFIESCLRALLIDFEEVREHLRAIEPMILQELIWRHDSPMWEK